MTDEERIKLAKIASKRVSDKLNIPDGVKLTGCTIVLGGGDI